MLEGRDLKVTNNDKIEDNNIMETIENVEFTFGELQNYILIRDKDLTGQTVDLLVTDREIQIFRERAEKMAHIIPKRKSFW